MNLLLRERPQLVSQVGNNQYMAGAIQMLLMITVPTFLFHQTLNEMPIRFILSAIRPR
jgi:hypothetical protein